MYLKLSAPLNEANLSTIKDLSKRFNVISGLSDHTMGSIAPITSVAFGAKIIEKHFILDKSVGGPDASFSMDQNEFKAMVESVRAAETCIGKVNYRLTEKQKNSREHSRSLFVVKDIKAGEIFTNQNVRSIRPGHGLHPKHLENIIGKKSLQKINKGTPCNFLSYPNSNKNYERRDIKATFSKIFNRNLWHKWGRKRL